MYSLYNKLLSEVFGKIFGSGLRISDLYSDERIELYAYYIIWNGMLRECNNINDPTLQRFFDYAFFKVFSFLIKLSEKYDIDIPDEVYTAYEELKRKLFT